MSGPLSHHAPRSGIHRVTQVSWPTFARNFSASAFGQEVTLTLPTNPVTFLLCHSDATLAAPISPCRDFDWILGSWGEGIWNDDINDASRD